MLRVKVKLQHKKTVMIWKYVGRMLVLVTRHSIETFGNESKVDQVNVLSASEVVTPLYSEKEEVKSSDVNSSDDDDDVPLSKLKMLSSMSHEIVNNRKYSFFYIGRRKYRD